MVARDMYSKFCLLEEMKSPCKKKPSLQFHHIHFPNTSNNFWILERDIILEYSPIYNHLEFTWGHVVQITFRCQIEVVHMLITVTSIPHIPPSRQCVFMLLFPYSPCLKIQLVSSLAHNTCENLLIHLKTLPTFYLWFMTFSCQYEYWISINLVS